MVFINADVVADMIRNTDAHDVFGDDHAHVRPLMSGLVVANISFMVLVYAETVIHHPYTDPNSLIRDVCEVVGGMLRTIVAVIAE